jgi:hypothetical protein
LSRGGTLKKKASVSRKSSIGRSGSRRSLAAGSIAGAGTPGAHDDYNSALSTPIPTHGSPTDILANRFQGMFQPSNLVESRFDPSYSMAHTIEVVDHIFP